jgi:hypothetical protein
MSMHFHRLANQSNSVVRAGSRSATLLPISNRGRQRAEIRPAPFNSEWSAVKAPIRPVPAGTEEISANRLRPSGVIIDFAKACGISHAPLFRNESSNESQGSLTIMDSVATIFIIMATAFYPALAWLLIDS